MKARHRKLGLDWRALFAGDDVVGLPLADARARFVAPSRYGDVLTIETRVAELHKRALVLSHIVKNGDQLAVEGTETRVWGVCDPNDGGRLRAGVIPDVVRARLGGDG